MRLVSAILVRNEGAEDRYLARVLQRCAEFSDRILVLDDNSTDQTCEIVLQCPKVTLHHRKVPEAAWGKESSARADLWQWGSKETGDGWLLIQDADMLLEGDPRPLCYSWEAAAWAFVLFDCWDDEDHARVDKWWAGGPQIPRPWLFCPSRGNNAALTFGPPDAMGRKNWTPQFNDRGIHVGHAPGNWNGLCFPAPFPQYYWKHLAYTRKEHRVAKHAQYLAVADQLTEFERQHAASILD